MAVCRDCHREIHDESIGAWIKSSEEDARAVREFLDGEMK
jgi:hypothetical protein